MATVLDLRQPPAGPPSTASVPPPARHWTTRVLIPVVLIGGLLASLAYALRDTLRSAVPVQVSPVVVRAGGTSSGAVAVSAAGWIEADPYAVTVAALADGLVREVLVLEGAAVAASQPVARLVDDDARLAVSRAEALLAQRRAEVAAAQAAAAAARQHWEHPIDEDRAIAVGEALVAQTQAELARLPSEVAAAKARARELREELERRQLAARGDAATRFEVNQAAFRVEQQEAVVANTEARRAVLEASLRQQEAELAAARRARELRIEPAQALAEAEAAVQRTNAALLEATAARDEAALRLERMTIRSPAAGVVLSRHVAPGQHLLVNADRPDAAAVVRVYDPSRLQVRVDVPLADAGRVQVGQEAEIVADILPGQTLRGRVTRVVHEADIQKNTLQVKVAIADPSAALRPEVLARVRLLAPATSQPSGTERLFVDGAAVRDADGAAWVWLLDRAAGVARRRAVTLGAARHDGWREVTAGLQPGDRVVVQPPAGLADGTRIRAADDAGPQE